MIIKNNLNLNKKRKGQFFLMGIIIIILSLTALNGILTQNRGIELSSMQRDFSLNILNQVEFDIYNIILSVQHDLIVDSIEEYLVYEREILRKAGYSLEFEKKINYLGEYPNDISINYTIQSQDVNLKREMKTNSWCVKYDYIPEGGTDNYCGYIGIITNYVVTATSCCTDFELCC